MSALFGLLGAMVGFGLIVAFLGARLTEVQHRPATTPLHERVERFVLRLALGVGAAVVMLLLTRWLVGGLLLFAAGFAAPSFSGGKRSRQASIAKSEAIAGWTEMLRDTMAGAAGIEQAIVATAPVSPPAIREEVLNLAVGLERERLADALRRFADDLGDPTGDLVVAALILAAEKQARKLGDLLGTLATSAREQANMRLRVEAGRARTRTAVRVIVTSTLAFALGLVVLNRGYLEPYDSLLGQCMLAVVGAFFGGSFWWLAVMARVGTPERFLATSAGSEVRS